MCKQQDMEEISIPFKQIGTILTPYHSNAPYQPVDTPGDSFSIMINREYIDGLSDLWKFSYAYVLFFAHKAQGGAEMVVAPPWAKGKKVGLFSSRSPSRPNPIGLSVVRIKEIRENIIFISGIDVFNGTPLLDIKPYIKDLDNKSDANYGWLDELDDKEHLTLHINGIPHEH